MGNSYIYLFISLVDSESLLNFNVMANGKSNISFAFVWFFSPTPLLHQSTESK